MNILPKKKWHVRTKENVARVRRDQKQAAEEAERIAERAKLAEQEFKVNLLRKNAEQRFTDMYGTQKKEEASGSKESLPIISPSGHVNFFADLEAEDRKNMGTGNKEYEEEKRKEREEYESKVGILKYLGEGSNEFTKQSSWYEKVPEKRTTETGARKHDAEKKIICGIKSIEDSRSSLIREEEARKERKKEKRKHKHKKEKHSEHKKRKKRKKERSTSDSDSDEQASTAKQTAVEDPLQKLRLERLRREEAEREKTAMLFVDSKSKREEKVVPKYSSQFNPELARQNRPR